MRRVLLVALVVALAAPAALAVTNGRPDSAFVRSISGGTVNWWNGSSWVAPTTGTSSPPATALPNADQTRDGLVEGFQFIGAGVQLELQFNFGNGQIGYSSNSGSDVNLALYFGSHLGANAIDSGTILMQDVSYSTDGSSWGAQLSLNLFLPKLGLSAPQPETAYYTNVSNAPSSAPVALRIRFLSVGGGATIWLAGIQNPEPGTLVLFGLGLAAAGTVVIRRRRRSKKL